MWHLICDYGRTETLHFSTIHIISELIKNIEFAFSCISTNKPKMAYSRDLAVMDYHGLSWFYGWLSRMTVMDFTYWSVTDRHTLVLVMSLSRLKMWYWTSILYLVVIKFFSSEANCSSFISNSRSCLLTYLDIKIFVHSVLLKLNDKNKCICEFIGLIFVKQSIYWILA